MRRIACSLFCYSPQGGWHGDSHPTCWVHVSCASYIPSSAASPCDRPYRRRVLSADLTPQPSSVTLRMVGSTYLAVPHCPASRLPHGPVSGFPLTCLNSGMPCAGCLLRQERMRAPKFLTLLSMHALMTPADPPESRPSRFLCIGFRYVNSVAICSVLLRM